MVCRRRIFIASVLIATVAPLAAAEVAVTGPASSPGVELHRGLPRDPVLVLAFQVEDWTAVQGGTLETLVGLAGGPAPFADLLARLRPGSAGATDDDEEGLLSLIGPEFALSVDLPPLDEAATAYAVNDDLEPLLRRVGLVARVRDERKTSKALRRLFESHDLETERVGNLVAVQLEMPGGGITLPPLYYGVRDERLAIGFGQEWVAGSLAGYPAGQRLEDGADFARIADHLDARPQSLTYINLPKLHGMITGSRLMQNIMSGNSEVGDFVNRVFNLEAMSVGLGVTSVAGDDGVRTSSFGPPWMTGPAVAGGWVAALAVPGWLHAADRGKTRKTLADIQSIALACEGFSTDAHGYPGPTQGWVPVEVIASHLEPIYIPSLPRVDAWRHPILYRSDGRSYRLISLGKDGRMDRDWSITAEPAASAEFDGDIVFADGKFLVLPGQVLDD